MKTADHPAFPRSYSHDGHNGLTKREYFAAMAMQGLYAAGAGLIVSTAFDAVRAADALIAELEKTDDQSSK